MGFEAAICPRCGGKLAIDSNDKIVCLYCGTEIINNQRWDKDKAEDKEADKEQKEEKKKSRPSQWQKSFASDLLKVSQYSLEYPQISECIEEKEKSYFMDKHKKIIEYERPIIAGVWGVGFVFAVVVAIPGVLISLLVPPLLAVLGTILLWIFAVFFVTGIVTGAIGGPIERKKTQNNLPNRLKEIEELYNKYNAIANDKCWEILELIPENYRNEIAVKKIGEYLRDGRADSMKEAINLYEEEKLRWTPEEIAKMQKTVLNDSARLKAPVKREEWWK